MGACLARRQYRQSPGLADFRLHRLAHAGVDAVRGDAGSSPDIFLGLIRNHVGDPDLITDKAAALGSSGSNDNRVRSHRVRVAHSVDFSAPCSLIKLGYAAKMLQSSNHLIPL